MKVINKQEFLKMLESHDWTYQYSDDHVRWTKGRQQRAAIMMTIQADESLRPLFDKFEKNMNIK